MGKQVGFLANEIDFNELLSFAEGCGFVSLPDLIRSDDEPKGVSPTEIRLPDESGSQCFHLLPPGISAAEVFYGEVSYAPNVSRLMKRVSPVTEVRPSQRDGSSLSDGRIHFNMQRDITHHEQGEKAYQRLARYIRKWKRTRQYRFHVGPHTVSEFVEGRLKLVHWNEVLSIAGT